VAKGQLRSNREKKKRKAEKNKKKSAPVPSVFERVRMIGKDISGEVLVAQSASIQRRKVRRDELTQCQSQHRERRAGPNVIKNPLDPALCADELEFSSQAYASACSGLRSL
jgi:hypothetical protein